MAMMQLEALQAPLTLGQQAGVMFAAIILGAVSLNLHALKSRSKREIVDAMIDTGISTVTTVALAPAVLIIGAEIIPAVFPKVRPELFGYWVTILFVSFTVMLFGMKARAVFQWAASKFEDINITIGSGK